MVAKNTICLWFNGTALDAAKFYTETFPDIVVGKVYLASSHFPAGKQCDILTVDFTINGIPGLGLNGGTAFITYRQYISQNSPPKGVHYNEHIHLRHPS